jgi:hypothetical protein
MYGVGDNSSVHIKSHLIKLFTTYSSVQKWYKGTEHMGAVFKLFGLSLHSFLTYKWLKYMFLTLSSINARKESAGTGSLLIMHSPQFTY